MNENIEHSSYLSVSRMANMRYARNLNIYYGSFRAVKM
jgi:hypothetical protein